MELILAAIAIMIYGGNKNLYNKIFTGDKKYTVGIIFIIGNIAGFFLNMRKLNVNDMESISILLFSIILGQYLV